MKKLMQVLIVAIILSMFLFSIADAKGRTGSKRVGGTNSHGKGSIYVGGRKFRRERWPNADAPQTLFKLPTETADGVGFGPIFIRALRRQRIHLESREFVGANV